MTLRFTKQQRLLKTDEFSSVFSLRRIHTNAFFQAWCKTNTLGHPRLGVVVAKRVERRAVGRNFIKRTIREVFRHEAGGLASLDLIVRAKRSFRATEAQAARQALLKLLERFR
ncbi:ribonuclease P protein component [Chitinimonas sp. BJYL2]|uniref:ribonuclease P protein component n=1 Tax=Chitinimonas sp. BJYL2 TaxID=2976696 RepID=UPI0027E50000|nr:ribonuclease P protein component [Chitinimonas sp. BJYL2]